MKQIFLSSLSLLLLSGCDRLATIPYAPQQTPESWLNIQPFTKVEIGTVNFILVQPSSTFLVYLLGIIAIGVGVYFLRIQESSRSQTWWGIALLLWGFGALFAGTSYQALSYEIKCAGRDLCSWTSWWEIIYLLLSVASINAMMIAGAFACCTGTWQKALVYYALANMISYAIVVGVGVSFLNKFMISFELLLLFTAPTILALFILNSRRYSKFKVHMDWVLVVTWLWLGATIAAYFIYLSLNFTDMLWEHGIWFSENDVLHLGLISWMVYIARNVAHQITDHTPAQLSEK
ncbi:MAG: hypothetical protein FJ031_14610 [Chloroflexi bacterium]|nr:hypothetical protein [Chloroflexota bacterium]